jgi:hypothetical protein
MNYLGFDIYLLVRSQCLASQFSDVHIIYLQASYGIINLKFLLNW